MLRSLATACLLCAACFSLETHGQAPVPLRAAGSLTTIELSPLLVAADKIYPGQISIINGGIPAIMSGMVDVATNAETQLLRQSVDDPDLRVIFTVAESFYRIVARKSAGIRRIADLKGKRITTPRNTSAHYYLVKMLATAHLAETDVTLVNINPVTEMSTALKDGRVDAVAMWEPEAERAIAAVGSDAIVLQDRRVYRELFNLNTSAKVLADPAKRHAVVELLRSLIASSQRIRQQPRQYWPLIASKLNYTVETVSRSWPDLRYAGGLVPDLLDVMTEEEVWVAKERNRTPRTRSQLASLIDRSLLDEALRKPLAPATKTH
ncbi:MAG: ABC transporter substrate-binding protein [Acidobacteriia bacterium]|nr:ABC transporter substrate-binding protein [Terriglobia bacterium]